MAKTSSLAIPVCENESISVDVRKIDNGFIKRTSRCGPEGYSSKEEFSKEKPQIETKEKEDTTAMGPSGLRKAMDSYKSQTK